MFCENVIHLTIQHSVDQAIDLQINPMKNQTINKYEMKLKLDAFSLCCCSSMLSTSALDAAAQERDKAAESFGVITSKQVEKEAGSRIVGKIESSLANSATGQSPMT